MKGNHIIYCKYISSFVNENTNRFSFFFNLQSNRPFNSQEALDKAKRAVEENYAVVGVLEDLNTTLTVLEHYVPRFFRGVSRVYHGLCLKSFLFLSLIVMMLMSSTLILFLSFSLFSFSFV